MTLDTIKLVLSFILISIPFYGAKAELILKDKRPDESGMETYEKTLSLSLALEHIKQIKSSLQSFKELTKASKACIQKSKINTIGNMGPEMQNIGFQNMPTIIEGVLRKQNYMIKKLQFALLEERHKTGIVSEIEKKNAELELSKSEQDFTSFWNDLSLVD